MQLSTVVATSLAVAATRSRLKKRSLLAAQLNATQGQDRALAVHYLSGNLPQGRIGVGPALLRSLPLDEPAATPTLMLAEVDATFSGLTRISGSGSKQARIETLCRLLNAATEDERRFLVRLLLGELRQGALEAVLIEAIADAYEEDVTAVRRAAMLAANLAEVAAVAAEEGAAGLGRFRLEPFKVVRPMLAQPAETIAAAIESLGTAILDYKLDGARVQIHRAQDTVRIFSRGLNDVTASLPEVASATLELPVDRVILDGEVIALNADGRPLPFQVTMRRFGRTRDVDALREEIPLSLRLFDCLLVDDAELIDEPLAERAARLAALAPADCIVPRLETADADVAARFFHDALRAGHEGLMAKAPASLYAAGSRGAEWLKIKQAHTLDLVVLAAEWGSGRRRGWLSNLHLGARDPDTGEFIMLGKTFKGLTDKLLEWQTEALLERETHRDGPAVFVRPELVVEIAVNEIQHSPHYPAGLALRFARVKRYRDDKQPSEADTIATVRQLHAMQTGG